MDTACGNTGEVQCSWIPGLPARHPGITFRGFFLNPTFIRAGKKAERSGQGDLFVVIEHREPDRRCRRIGPVDAVAAMRCDVDRVAGERCRASASSAKRSRAEPASNNTHSPSCWSYQKPGGLAWPNETMRSRRISGRVSSTSTASALLASGNGANRFTRGRAFEFGTVPPRQIGRDFVCALQELQQCRFRRRRLADRVIGEDEFADIAVVRRRRRAEPPLRQNRSAADRHRNKTPPAPARRRPAKSRSC